jgi:TIR domain
LEGVGIDFFLDAVSLRSGEIWERRLYEEIDRSDVFMLFWSKNVEQTESKWIEREVTYALNRQEASEDQLPCFRPTFLGGDKPNRPPWLPAHIQFDNALRRHLLAVRHDRGGY